MNEDPARLEESAEDLYENAPCGYLSTAPDGTIVRVNATLLRWTGYARDDLVGVKRFVDLLTVGGRIYHETHYAPMLRMQGTVREIAVDLRGADGGRLSVLINSVLVRDADGEPRLIRTTVFDATERKLYERELIAARDRERVARERVERLQRLTAAVAGAEPGDVGRAVVDELVAELGLARAVVAVQASELEAERDGTLRVSLGGEGWLWLELGDDRALDADELAFVRTAGQQAAVALARARLHEETQTVAESLQRSLLAVPAPRDPRFDVASAYRPAIATLQVGGDWHDAFRLPGDRVAIVVGDVVGRGLAAASAMGQLRSAVRALAAADLEPAAILHHLDAFVEQIEAARYATLAYADVDPAGGRVTFAAAGHLPPALVGADGAVELYMGGRSTPLGVGAERPQASFELTPGAGFVLYTDGLVERRGEPIDVGIDRLLAAIRASPDRSPRQLAATLPDALLEHGAGEDDVCLLSFRLN